MSPVRPCAVPDVLVPTGSESAALDRRAIEALGVPESALMERAGSGAAALLRELFPGASLLVLAGKGNNGGDALVLARCAAAWGHRVAVLHVADGDDDRGLLHGWPLPAAVSAALDDDALDRWLASRLGRETVVVDGMLGTGARGAPRGEPGRVLERLARLREDGAGEPPPVLALDIPSGVDADTGDAAEGVLAATVTVCFGWPKMGALLHPGRARCGRLVAVEIGFPPNEVLLSGDAPEPARALTPAWAAPRRPRREPVTHKNRVGGLTVVGGRPEFTGAILLAGRAGLRGGAGYLRVVTDPANRAVVQAALPEAVAVDWTDAGAVREGLAAARGVVAGPGLGTGDAARALLGEVLAAGIPAVLDADALTVLAAHPGILADEPRDDVVLTPHPGEAARLLDRDAAAVTAEPWAAAEALKERFGGVILLKGTPSLVLDARGRRWVDTVGSSDLAQAGMGDTLAGCVGAFLAQGTPPGEAAALGLLTTGRAVARAGRGRGTQSGDVPDLLPAVLEEGAGETTLRLPGVLLDLDPAR